MSPCAAGALVPTSNRGRSTACDDLLSSWQAGDSGQWSAHRSFAQPAACLQVRAALTPEPTKREGRKPRASERHAVGCSEELACSFFIGRVAALPRDPLSASLPENLALEGVVRHPVKDRVLA